MIMPENVEHMGGALTNVDFVVPMKITYGHIESLKVPKATIQIHRPIGKFPELKLEFKVEETLPASYYAILTCPFRVDTDLKGLVDSRALRNLLDCFAAVFRSQLGMNALWRLAYEGERFASNGIWASALGPVTRFPQPIEGPDFGPANWSGIAEIANAITATPATDRGRLLLALQYMHRGCEGSDFIHYWTALEILAGKAPKIRALLAKAYGFKRQHDVDEKLYFWNIAQWRHDLVHKGRPVDLSAEMERYLQCLFLDVIRHLMGLEHRAYTAALLSRPELDFTLAFTPRPARAGK